jgi:mannose-6-phosphate isomerase-like protein (cupin superfamily)
MPPFRRIVTGSSPEGRAVFASDGPPPRTITLDRPSGGEACVISWIWSTEETPGVPHDRGEPTVAVSNWFPGETGSRFIIETMAPGFGVDDLEHVEDYTRQIEASGMRMNMDVHDGTVHATSTIDYGVVISGQIWLELDDGAEVRLDPGDCIVQTGVRHSWRNRGTEPCTIAFVILGAHRTGTQRR